MLSFGSIRNQLGLTEEAISNETIHKEFCNNFFYANVCQYCVQVGEDRTVKRCSNCDGVYYCSREHQLDDRERHKNFCNVLKFIKTNLKKHNIFENMPMNDTSFKNYLMDLAEIQLNRPLTNCEKQVFQFPRVCLICNESNPSLVKSCKNCSHANFCVKHLKDPNHERECRFFTFCFYLDHFLIIFKALPFADFINAFPRNAKYTPLPENILQFLIDNVRPHHNYLFFDSPEVQMHVGIIFFRALTVIYALQRLNLTRCTQLTIHVICKIRFDDMNHNEWEILFHWFPKLKSLKIVLIGCKGLPRQVPTRLCHLCRGIKRSLKVEAHFALYRDYYHETQQVPDLIVAFDVDMMTFKTWENSSIIISYMKTPILLTSMVQADLLAGVQDCVEDPNNFSQIILNPFGSMRPERSSRSVVYPSHFLSIYGDNFPKIGDILKKDNTVNQDSVDNTKAEAELREDFERSNATLEQKYEIYLAEVEKIKYRNEQLVHFLAELHMLSTQCTELEKKVFEVFDK